MSTGSPKSRRAEIGVAAQDVGPYQRQRQEIGHEYDPQRRNAHHRGPRAFAALPRFLFAIFMTIP